MRYEIVAEAYRDLEAASARLTLIDRLAKLFTQTPPELVPTVALLCQGQIAPDFAGSSWAWRSGWPAGPWPPPPGCRPSRSWPGPGTPATWA